jgi:hypothetical protein
MARDKNWLTVLCGSHSLTMHEGNWSGVAELEALVVAWVAFKCAFFLDGPNKFTVATDCKPLANLLNNKRLDQIKNNRLFKLWARLSHYNFTAHWTPGSQHTVEDTISQRPTAHPSPKDIMGDDSEDNKDYIITLAVLALEVRDQDWFIERIWRAMGADMAG